MDKDIIWITFRGRRIPIKKGMKGKFNKKEENISKIKDMSGERPKTGLEDDKTNNWREQIKKNNEETDRITRDLESRMNSPEYKYHHDKWQDDYYGAFRENERRNAKIKIEEPEELYENVPAYAGYEEKSWKLSGSKKNNDGSTDFGNKSWSGKEYTNDEFMEHLTDSNWHSERKALEDAKLTNQELAYIKDRTTLSQWGVGEELTGKDNVNKMIREAKQHFTKDKGFAKRYEGSIDYLQKNTNLSYEQIIEFLKKLDKGNK